MDFCNLDVIISVGYRLNSVRATQFRQREFEKYRKKIFLIFSALPALSLRGIDKAPFLRHSLKKLMCPEGLNRESRLSRERTRRRESK
jgi:hypothetical protein